MATQTIEGTPITGHRLGCTYFSVRHHMRYDAVGLAKVWELGPDRTLLEWENGNSTATDEPRGSDPEVCRRCDGLIHPPTALRESNRHCRCAS